MVFEQVKKRRARLVGDCVGKLLEQGKRESKVRANLDVSMAVKILTGMLDTLIVPEKLIAMGLSPQKGLAFILNMLMKGLL